MNKLVFTTCALMLASAAVADEVDQTLDADANGRVVVSNLSGSVEVIGWDRNQVQVTGTIGDDVDDFIFERSGRTTTIKVKVPDRSWSRKDVSSELVIRVPEGSSLDIGTVSADIDVEGVQGEQDLDSVSGDIETEGVVADVQAETVSGDVDVIGEGEDGDWAFSSVSGDVTAEGLSGDIDVEVVSGDIDVSEGGFDSAELESVNGDIVFNATLRESGRLDIETVNGSVEVEFVGSVSARFDVETFNGRIRNCFGPAPERVSHYAPGWELSFTEGDGDSRVSIATLNGGVEICRE